MAKAPSRTVAPTGSAASLSLSAAAIPAPSASQALATAESATSIETQTAGSSVDAEKTLPLPGWLKKVYFIFPVILYIPDVIFNYYVYSDGFASAKSVQTNWLLAIGQTVLIGFLSIGIVGMAYLLSVLAPWHWGRGHRVQAIFCGVGVLIATAITTWNSLAYRSVNFTSFKTDQWAYQLWPQLRADGISISMILVSIAPPFWGLFWAIVQPTETGRNLRQLQESHTERLMRMQQEAELKRLKAETNATIREAQLRGMAQTAAAARDQASGFLAQRRKSKADGLADGAADPSESAEALAQIGEEVTGETLQELAPLAPEQSELPTLLQMPRGGREMNESRTGMVMYNHAPATSSSDVAHMAPSADVLQRPAQPAVLGGVHAFFPTARGDADAMSSASGPHTAVRGAVRLGTLSQQMNEPLKPAHVQAIKNAFKNYSDLHGKQPNAAELTAAVADELHVSESAAKKIIATWREMEKSRRRS